MINYTHSLALCGPSKDPAAEFHALMVGRDDVCGGGGHRMCVYQLESVSY